MSPGRRELRTAARGRREPPRPRRRRGPAGRLPPLPRRADARRLRRRAQPRRRDLPRRPPGRRRRPASPPASPRRWTTVADHGEPDTVTRAGAARHRPRRPGDRRDDRRARCRPIDDCHDCADFLLVPLLWARSALRRGARRRRCATRIDAAILGYRYWMDEPGNDVQWYFSENHALLFHTAAYLAGHLLPDARFRRSGRTGARAVARSAAARVRAWLDHFERWEMAEFNSAPYFPIDLKGLTALFALAPDADIRERAGRGDRPPARDRRQLRAPGRAHRGAGPLLRAHAARRPVAGALRHRAHALGPRQLRHALPRPAAAGALPARPRPRAAASLAGVARLAAAPTRRSGASRQGQDRFAALYHYKTRDFAMGTAAALPLERVGLPGDGAARPHRRANREAQIWINHPGETIQSGYRPAVLLGRLRHAAARAPVPRPRRRRLRLRRRAARLHPRLVPARRLRRDLRIDRRPRPSPAAARRLRRSSADGPLEPVATGPTRRQRAAPAPAAAAAGSCASATPPARRASPASAARFAGLVTRDGGRRHASSSTIPTMVWSSSDADGTVEAEGRRLDPADWTPGGHAGREIRAGPSPQGDDGTTAGRSQGPADTGEEHTMKLRLPRLRPRCCSAPRRPPPGRRRPHHVVFRRRRGRGHRGPAQALHEGQPRHQRHPRQRRLPGGPGAAADPARGRPGPRHRPRHQPQGAGAALARPDAPTSRTPTTGDDQLRRPRSTGCAPTAPRPSPAS